MSASLRPSLAFPLSTSDELTRLHLEALLLKSNAATDEYAFSLPHVALWQSFARR